MGKVRVRLSKDVEDFSTIGNLFNEAKPVKVKRERKKKIGHLTDDFGVIKFKPAKKEAKKKAKKAKKVKAVEDMTPGERAQHKAGKVANRLYGAKAKAPKFA